MSTEQARFDGDPWKNADTLRGMYHDDQLNQSEIADELGTTPSNISYWMKKLEISTTHSEYENGGKGGREDVGSRECWNYDDCGNMTPGGRNQSCTACLDAARSAGDGHGLGTST